MSGKRSVFGRLKAAWHEATRDFSINDYMRCMYELKSEFHYRTPQYRLSPELTVNKPYLTKDSSNFGLHFEITASTDPNNVLTISAGYPLTRNAPIKFTPYISIGESRFSGKYNVLVRGDSPGFWFNPQEQLYRLLSAQELMDVTRRTLLSYNLSNQLHQQIKPCNENICEHLIASGTYIDTLIERVYPSSPWKRAIRGFNATEPNF